MTFIDDATKRQIAAAHPTRSTWVSANAGSGKTKVLTDRVARLLLDGTPPQHVLCLTYTKAAASEMQNRLFKRLGAWAMMPNDELKTELSALAPDIDLSDDDIRHARTLFARAVETPGGLKIQTIHSFCGALLRRFPLEAGVSPQFKELDERQIHKIVAASLDSLATGPQKNAIDGISTYIADLDAESLAMRVVYNREKFKTPASKDDIWGWFGLPAGYDEDQLLRAVFIGDEDDGLRKAAHVMEVFPNKVDPKAAEILKSWIGQPRSVQLLHDCCAKLLVGSGENAGLSKFGRARAGLPSKKCADTEPEALRQLSEFMRRVESAADKLASLRAAKKTFALHTFARALLPLYLEAKTHLGLLDFDDLIQKARDLLSNSSVAQWVLFRLDGGIDHILVDEAQDTSPDQWTVIRLLAEEFTVGEGSRPGVVRTIFVVGDKKQSIYSFQGAAPDAFDDMKEHFRGRLNDAQNPLQDLALQHSFRSSPAILTFTDVALDQIGGQGVGGKTEHIAFFDDIPGRVDLWPLVEPEPAEPEPDDWENPRDLRTPQHHSIRLAGLVAEHVKELISEGSIPRKGTASTNIRPGDILILVRNRSGLFYPMIRALKKLSLPVAGADQLILNEELAVKDIASLLAFLSLQDDDLALAEALKSPLFGWSEQDLYSLAHGRTAVTLWRELFERKDEWPKTAEILDDLRRMSDFLRPYDLIQRILIRHNGRRKFLARLGIEAEDGLDALLHQALHYETTETPSLTGFLSWLGAEEIKLKRVLDESSNLIRVMTVHGSKGLEAPIVILPDTLRETQSPKDEVVDLGDGNLAWKLDKDSNPERLNMSLNQLKERNEEEEKRLLYVAMTRAENWLIVAGAGKLKKDSTSWYSVVDGGMGAIGGSDHNFPSGSGRRHQHGTWPARDGGMQDATSSAFALPHWASAKLDQPQQTQAFISPSDLGGAKALFGGGIGDTDEAAMRKGRQLHVLLEHLPSHPKDEWKSIAQTLLSSGEDFALPAELDSLLEEFGRVHAAQYAWDIFGSDTLSEVPFSGTLPSLANQKVHGVIDKLIVTEHTVQIVDYKSNQTVPDDPAGVPEGLLRQLGAYAEVCAQIYPDRTIETAILWTCNATLMPLSLDMVMSALRRAATS